MENTKRMKTFKIKTTLLFILFCIYGCQIQDHDPTRNMNEKQTLIDDIRYKVSRKIYKETGLIPFGSGGQARKKVVMLHLAFQHYGPLDLGEGRELAIKATRELINAVNAETKLHPYLSNYPFDARNIEICIFVKDKDGRNLPSGKLSIIGAYRGTIEYRSHDASEPRSNLVWEESFEEALKKIEETKIPL
jgi:hypothetical protein